MGLTQITTGGVDDNINIDSNTLKVDGTNNRIGINTATPSAPLDVVGNDGIAIQSSAQSNEFLIRPSSSSADGIRFTQAGGGGDRMVIDGSGKVGINKTPSTYQLEVNGGTANTVASFESSDATARILFKDNSGEAMVGGTGDAVTFYTSTSATERMRINSSGRLLLNTTTVLETSNAAKLQITHSSGASIALGRDDSAVSAGNDLGKIAFYGNDGGGYEKVAQILCEADGTHASGDKPGRLLFQTTADNASSPTERMRIDSSGNVGISTTTTSGANLVIATNSNSGSGIKLIGKSANGGAEIDFRNNADDTLNGFIEFNDNGGILSTVVNQPQAFRTNNTERMRIDGDGRLLLGLTSSIGGDAIFQVQGSGNRKAHFHQPDSGGSIIQFTNTTTGTGTSDGFEIALNGSEDGQVWLYESGDIKFGTANSERLRIDSSGRLLVGTTTNIAPDGFESKIQTAGTDYRGGSISIRRDQNSASGPTLTFTKSRGTLVGHNTVVQNGDVVAQMAFYAADGGDVNQAAGYIRCRVDGTPGGNDMPGRLELHTTADNAASPTERLRITSTGQLQSHSEGSTTLKPMQGCRAFCCFKGTGTVSIHSSFNVSALTDLDTGHYQINFSTAMIDNSYGVTTGFQRNAANDEFVNVGYDNITTRLRAEFFDSGTRTDCQRMTVAVFR